MPNIGSTEIIVVALVLMVLFGSSKLIEFARGLGETKKELKKVKEELDKE